MSVEKPEEKSKLRPDCSKCKGKDCVVTDNIGKTKEVRQVDRITHQLIVKHVIERDDKGEPILIKRKRCIRCGDKN